MGGVERHVLGQIERQVLGLQGAESAVGLPVGVQLVQDRERLAPEMLAAEEPVAELVIDRRPAQALVGQVGRDMLFELRGRQTVVAAAVDGPAVADERERPSVLGSDQRPRSGLGIHAA